MNLLKFASHFKKLCSNRFRDDYTFLPLDIRLSPLADRWGYQSKEERDLAKQEIKDFNEFEKLKERLNYKFYGNEIGKERNIQIKKEILNLAFRKIEDKIKTYNLDIRIFQPSSFEEANIILDEITKAIEEQGETDWDI